MSAADAAALLVLHLCLGGLQSLCQLIGAGGDLQTAGSAFQTGDNIVNVHAIYQAADTLEVTVTTAQELDVLYLAIFNIEEDALGASALSLIFKLHCDIPFCVCFVYYTRCYRILQV